MEYLRQVSVVVHTVLDIILMTEQAVMCHGDLTLERPEGNTYPHRTTGWGNAHRCRDWDSLITAVKEHAIERGPHGWKKTAE